MKNVAIVGGGLAGLISGILLAKKGVPCEIFEKKTYPFNRVCGEYISNEAVPFLKKFNLYPNHLNLSQLKNFQISSVGGESATMPLDMGGFGISRYAFDHFLAAQAKAAGVMVRETCEVDSISFTNQKFSVSASGTEKQFDVVIGAFGKRSKLDLQMKRAFVQKRSPYVAIKYHVKVNHPADLIALHNFDGGYCGVSKIENGLTNICYLVHRDVLQQHGNVSSMEEKVLFRNPFLKKVFTEAEFVFEKPFVINEVSFETKSPVENHMLMVGDAAGMIAPLCGNGMAMAIHSGMLAAEFTFQFSSGNISREKLEREYARQWNAVFAGRLQFGRMVQKLFGNRTFSHLAVKTIIHSKPISNLIMRNTHGKVF